MRNYSKELFGLRSTAITLLFFGQVLNAEIYKCIDIDGKIKYQSQECNDNEKKKIMVVKGSQRAKIKELQSPNNFFSERNNLDGYGMSQDSRTDKDLENLHHKKCRTMRKQFKIAEKKVIAKCKRNRDTFCHLSAIEIEKNERNMAIRQITSSRGGGVVRIPAFSDVEYKHKQLIKNSCL